MRFKSVRLKNFRGVKDSFIEFGPGVTIIEAPNETGKSSIPEAVRLLRTMPATSEHRSVNAVVPLGSDQGPEVELVVETADLTLKYRKRWKKSPITELEVSGAAAQNYTGREAHARFEELLAANSDLTLLEALEIRQGASMTQADVASAAKLRSVLGEASDQQATTDDLLDAVSLEYQRYFGKSGKPVGRLRALESERLEAKQLVSEAQNELDRLEGLTERRRDLSSESESLKQRLADAQAEMEAAAEATASLRELKTRRSDSRSKLELAESTLEAAAAAAVERQKLIENLRERQSAQQTTMENQEALQRDSLAAEAVVARLTAAHEEAKANVSALRQDSKAIEGRLRIARSFAEADRLDAQIGQAKTLETQAAQARAVVDSVRVDADVIAKLRELAVAKDVAERTRATAAGMVSIEPLAENPVLLNGDPVSQDTQVRILGDLEIEVPGAVRVKVSPGTSGTELEQAVAQADEQLEDALAAAGAKDLAEAEELFQKLEASRTSLATAEAALGQALADDSLSALVARRELVKKDLEGHDRPAATVSDLDARFAEARTQLEQAQVVEAESADALRRAEQAAADCRAELAGAQTALTAATAELTALEQALSAARGKASDAALLSAQEEAEQHAEDARATLARVETELEQARPEKLELRETNAKGVLQRVQSEIDDNQADIHRVEGELTAGLRSGPSDRLSEAVASAELLESEYAALNRRATAARVLYEELQNAASQAQEQYVAPLKNQIETLGRLVFPADFSVQLDTELKVVSRTVGGVTVPFDSLSGGTKEQIALLTRLACAQLVDPQDGAPVIIDDALGHADPARLKDLNATIAAVGDRSQIIVLTCQPDRFQLVGGATVVRMRGTFAD